MGRKGTEKGALGRKRPEVSASVYWRDKRSETEGWGEITIHSFRSCSKRLSSPVHQTLGTKA